MKPDSSRLDRRRSDRPRLDDVERAHLKRPDDASHTMSRYPASAELTGLVRRYWVPVWSVPPGEESPQQVLQYPICLIVVSAEYARFYGVVSGLSTTTLSGTGWAFGVMLQPSAGYLITGRCVAELTDRHVDLDTALGADGTRLAQTLRSEMQGSPQDERSHRTAIATVERQLVRHLPVDDEGLLVNDVADYIEQSPEVTRVRQVSERFQLTDRTLQRLVHRRVGLTPKWLIQRRRLQEAAERLRDRTTTVAEVAAVLGYADQPHLSRDFATVTGMTPGQFARRYEAHGEGPQRRE